MSLRGFVVSIAIVGMLLNAQPAFAGTTGGIHLKVTDATTGAPVAGAAVNVIAASQKATGVTDASGELQFNSLGPDEYAVSVTKEGYGKATSDEFVFADQVVSVNLKLGKTESAALTAAAGILQPGVTSNFASIDARTLGAFRGLQGNDSYDQTYGAMNSQPGIFSPQSQAGWYQRIYIRGGDQDQPGYEYDGIPVEHRDWQSSPLINFSSLGVQELQVYTGGLLATSDATGIAGYVNEVVKSGTAPAFLNVTVGGGAPMFYHKLQVEAGNATDHFSYYVGMLGANSTYRYVDQNNGPGLQPAYFFPIQLDGTGMFCNAIPAGYTAVYMPAPGVLPPVTGPPTFTGPPFGMCFDGGQRAWNGSAGFTSAPGALYGINTIWDRENVGNFHFFIPHRKNPELKDDIQLLVMESEMYNTFQNSFNDFGAPTAIYPSGFVWPDGARYTGAVGAPPVNGATAEYVYPGSPAHSFQASLPNTKTDFWSNGAALVKLQYQWNINTRSFLRAFGYTTYSDWLLNSPASLNANYGLMAADWEPATHTAGGILNYANQFNKQNYLTVSAGYERTLTHGWSSSGLFGQYYTPVGNLTNTSLVNPYCYNPGTGAQDSCYNANIRAPICQYAPAGAAYIPANPALCVVQPNAAPAGTPGAAPGIGWMITENGLNHYSWDATPVFTSFGFNDQYRPNDRWTFDLGFRTETYKYQFPNVLSGYPARAFWFNVYNNEHCFQSGTPNIQVLTPVLVAPLNAGAGCGTGPKNFLGAPLYTSVPNYTATNVTAANPSSLSSTVYEPRLGFALTLDANNVVRGSWGVGARPPTTAWMQFGGEMQDLASFLGNNFLQYGFNSPVHALEPDRSYNLDATWEHLFKGTDMGFRVTPYLRKVANQQQVFAYNAVLGLTAGLNVGHQVSSGIEFEFSKGNFNAQGWSWKFAYTHNRSRITYANFANGTNVIDQINYYIHQYNQFTSACAAGAATNTTATCGLNYTGANAQPTFTVGATQIYNPYFGKAPATPFDRGASYTTYDVFPAPFYGDNGYEMPDFGSLTVNYRHGRWAVTPSIVFQSGAYYGNPLTTPGYDPTSCTASTTAGPVGFLASPTSCQRAIFTPQVLGGLTQFDQIGQFRQPWRLSGDLQISYDVSPRVRAHLTLMHIVDHCFQRGYTWDRPYVCEYSQLPGNTLPSTGNITTLPLGGVAPPKELQYPYGAWNINYNTDYQGVVTPFQANLEFEIKV